MNTDAGASDGVDLPAPRSRFILGPRFAPGPLTAVKRPGPSGAAKGALVGGIVALAVLAALSLPLVVALVEPQSGERLAEAPRPKPSRSAAVAVPKPVATPAPEPPPAAVVVEASVAPPAAQEPARQPSALGLHSLPTLTQQAEDIDVEPEAAPPPVAPRAAQRAAAQRRSAQPKP